jgi:hypothetical protein
LVPGERADFVLFRFDQPEGGIRVVETWLDGDRA